MCFAASGVYPSRKDEFIEESWMQTEALERWRLPDFG